VETHLWCIFSLYTSVDNTMPVVYYLLIEFCSIILVVSVYVWIQWFDATIID